MKLISQKKIEKTSQKLLIKKLRGRSLPKKREEFAIYGTLELSQNCIFKMKNRMQHNDDN